MLKLKIYIFFIILFVSKYCNGQDSPNFLWLICEDQSLFFSMYGDSSANTPNINQLSNDGMCIKIVIHHLPFVHLVEVA